MIKQLAALALAGSVILGSASSAVAHKIPRQPFSLEGTNFLLRTVEGTGHKVYNNSSSCEDPGIYGFAIKSKKALVICVKNLEGDKAELADTVRHEAFHLAQFCKADKVGATAALIYPELTKEVTRLAGVLGMPFSKYRNADLPYEAEARAAAFIYNDQEIAQILSEEC